MPSREGEEFKLAIRIMEFRFCKNGTSIKKKIYFLLDRQTRLDQWEHFLIREYNIKILNMQLS